MNAEDQKERPRKSITCEPDDESSDPILEAWLKFRKEDGERP